MEQKVESIYPIVISFFIIYIVWGSTYLANTWVLESIPPFLLSGSRFIVAGTIMLLIARIRGTLIFTKPQIKNAAFAGLMFFAIGNGLVVWGLQYVESGIAALLIALQPIVVALLLIFIKKELLSKISWIGLATGLLGMIVLIGQPQFVGNSQWMYGFIAIIIAIISWGYVSVWISSADLPSSVFQSAALQMLLGGIMLTIMSFAFNEPSRFVFHDVTLKSWVLLAYLVVFGSIIAFTAFNYLLLKVSPVKVSTATYVNPIIALFLGWWLNNEGITYNSILASGLLLIGVFLINVGKKRALENGTADS